MTTLRRTCFGLLLCAPAALQGACRERRPEAAPEPVYAGDVGRLLEQRCADCHEDADAGGSFGVGDYLDVLGCPFDMPETSAVARADSGIPLLEVLKRPDHARLLDAHDAARLKAWLLAGVPLRVDGVHAPGILNPRSRDWHGRFAAQNDFGPISNPNHPSVCGRCHAGAPVTPKGVTHPAPGAPACTSCHRQPEGVLACGTCHGDGAARAYPPRDACMFPGSRLDAHRAHVESTRLSSTKLSCTTCHPAVQATPSATHANGHVDVVFDAALVGPDASYDRASGRCAVRCHNQGGTRAMPNFVTDKGPLGCGDCHGAPPANHYQGPCDRCHAEPNADGSALRPVKLHMNGRVDLGDGSGGCTACHGQGDDPMPDTPSHRLHRNTQLTAAIACSECHLVPEQVTSPGHLGTSASPAIPVVFGERAKARGRSPSYANGTCRDIACHGAGLPEGLERPLVWDTPGSRGCGSCHGIPPAAPHPQDAGCGSSICHGTEISADSAGPQLTTQGRALHINGRIDTVQP